MNKKSILDIDVKGKKCLVRVDFNVPIKEGKITDETRIIGALDTIKYLMEHNAKTILCSHLGRPKGTFNMDYTLRPVYERLNELLNGKVTFATDVIGPSAKEACKNVKEGEVVLIENLRFHAEEEKNDTVFCGELAGLADGEVYVNDAFGTAHRAHASTAGVAPFFKQAVCGFLIEKEIRIMGGALDNPARPFVVILGGAKVSDKIGVINNLIEKCDELLIGGAMAYTFIKAQGKNIGTSRCEEDKLDLAKELLEKAKNKNVQLLLPVDSKVASEFVDDSNFEIADSDNMPDGKMGLDIGPKTIKLFSEEINKAKTVIWNGPMGVFEFKAYKEGTEEIARALANSNATTIIGGGDSAAAVTQMGFSEKMTHISTGGGASLEYLEGLVLPGVDCLNNK